MQRNKILRDGSHRVGVGATILFNLISDIRPSNINIYNFCRDVLNFHQRNLKKKVPEAVQGEGAKFIFCLILEIGPSNIKYNFLIIIKEIFFEKWQGRPRDANFSSSLLLEIGPLYIIINIFILIKELF